mmetsp:Transcript_75120/g.132770  ORF Transcript_75120/g.132770 Transcript_75120/m.132770 type:complete len:219 (-) Transcript_75120:93-749(-)
MADSATRSSTPNSFSFSSSSFSLLLSKKKTKVSKDPDAEVDAEAMDEEKVRKGKWEMFTRLWPSNMKVSLRTEKKAKVHVEPAGQVQVEEKFVNIVPRETFPAIVARRRRSTRGSQRRYPDEEPHSWDAYDAVRRWRGQPQRVSFTGMYRVIPPEAAVELYPHLFQRVTSECDEVDEAIDSPASNGSKDTVPTEEARVHQRPNKDNFIDPPVAVAEES